VDLEALLGANPTLVNTLANALHKAFSLTLFGFDVIAARITPGQRTAVPQLTASMQKGGYEVALHAIDVNYFPSYRMAGAATYIREALQAKLLQHST
jgi:hypothetical protein